MRLLYFLMAGFVGLASASLARADAEEPDAMEVLISSYTEVLLIGHACKDHGAAGHHAIVQRTIKDFIELGMTEEVAAETVEGLIETEGPRVVEIIRDEAKNSRQGAILYCTTAYPAAVSKLDQARIAIAKVLREADQEKGQKN